MDDFDESKIPQVLCWREPSRSGECDNLKFFCQHRQAIHSHGVPPGWNGPSTHRCCHCFKPNSSYARYGYDLVPIDIDGRKQ